MTTTKQTEIGTIESGVNYSYPMGIASVPFASFLKILKYSYDCLLYTSDAADE